MKQCAACDNMISGGSVGYDLTHLKTWCYRDATCALPHNKPEDVYKLEDLEEALYEKYPPKVAERIASMLNRPTSVRLSPAGIMAIIRISSEEGTGSISETVNRVLEDAEVSNSEDLEPFAGPKRTQVKETLDLDEDFFAQDGSTEIEYEEPRKPIRKPKPKKKEDVLRL